MNLPKLPRSAGPIVGIIVAVTAVVFALLRGSAPKPHTLGAPGIPPVLNPNWNVIQWVTDIQNASGCASDTNNCTSTTCGAAGSGVGPCQTYDQIDYVRWGCIGSPLGCPRITDGLTHTVIDLSSDTGNANPRYVRPALEQGSSLVFKASLPTPSHSGAFTSVAQWTTSCGSPRVTDSGFNVGVPGAFLVDTTVGARLWCDEFSSGHNCQNTIPVTAVTAPPTAFQTPGLWTTATGGAGSIGTTDSYNEFNSLVTINYVDLTPTISDWVGSPPTNGVFLYNENILDPGGVGADRVNWGPGVTGYEIRSDRIVNVLPAVNNRDEGCVNCWLNGGIMGGRLSTGHFWHANSGEITSNATICNATGAGIALDGYNLIEASPCTFLQGVSIGLTKNDSGGTMSTAGYSALAAISPGYSTVFNGVELCGSGFVLNLLSGTFAYDSSHGGATGIMPNAITYEIAGLSTGESHSGTSPVVVTGALNITTTNLDGAASTTQFGGFAYGPGGIIRKL